MTGVQVPHFDFPFQFVAGANGEVHAAVNEQDTVDDISACISAIVSTPLGYREELPDFGVRDQTFAQGGVDTEEIQTAIALWEPRADIILSEDPSQIQYFIDQVTIRSSAVNPVVPTPNEQDVT